ncbi:phosphatase PAP2 family protein [Sphingomonas jatrophae]|uniref:Undecaprenyl-diphosphatase n=1 Tax=Sphingomonas jatrophae TaxID=1166337 RepID=A0A1I6LMK2_9SPHN|nr:phosphatase PAP2 family protein [Sphingomonas jatrophae]SFS04671.1 undecaprenyl-diphosphatase [Sphingomonas jatrophae]
MLSRVRGALLGFALAAGLALILLKVGALLDSGWGGAWDKTILSALYGALPPARVRAVTALGSGVVLTLVVAIAAGAMAVAGRWRQALLLVAAALSGSLAVDLLKHAVARLRPALFEHLEQVGSASFPSAHAANSAIVYLSLAAAVAALGARPPLARFALVTGIALTLAIGASRIVLGVHWPSDVLAGWLFGATWAFAWARLARRA